MALAANVIVDTLLSQINKEINDAYARGEIDKDPQYVVVDKGNLSIAFRDAYIKMLEVTPNAANRLPPASELHKAKVFSKAGAAAFEYIEKSVTGGSKINKIVPDAPRSTSHIEFTQSYKSTNIFTRMKSAGIKEINTYLTSKETAALSDVGSNLEADKSLSVSEAFRLSEDINVRRYVHREHTGSTTTGNATLAGRLQAIESFLPGSLSAIEKSNKISNLLGTIKSAYVTELTDAGLIQVVAKNDVHIKLGSFKFNASGARKSDLVNTRKAFNKAVKAVLKAGDLSKLAEFESAKALSDHIANKLAKSIGVKVTGAKYTQVKAAVIRKINREKSLNNRQKVASKKMAATPTSVPREEVGTFAEESIRTAMFLKLDLQAKIRQVVTANMEAPALVYRTGRFASSVIIEDVTWTEEQKIPSIKYNYQLAPYSVFAPGGKMFTPDRNPQKLIEGSIREIAREMMITKLSIRRP